MHQTRFYHHLILVLSNHQNHRQVPILTRSHPHFPGFSRENNQALLERGSINLGFHITGEIRSEIYDIRDMFRKKNKRCDTVLTD